MNMFVTVVLANLHTHLEAITEATASAVSPRYPTVAHGPESQLLLWHAITPDACDVARRRMKTKALLWSRDLRQRVEMFLAHLETLHRF
jgi:hypothetical protein